MELGFSDTPADFYTYLHVPRAKDGSVANKVDAGTLARPPPVEQDDAET